MRAAVLRRSVLDVADIAEPPDPRNGEILVETVATGICGSDIHLRRNVEQFLDTKRRIGEIGQVFDPDTGVVLGHEFAFRVLAKGPGVDHIDVGDYGTGYPTVVDRSGLLVTVGFSSVFPGGYGERMLLSAGAAIRLPDGMDPVVAALTEPLTVGEMSARRCGIGPGDTGVVLGTGPVGLGTVAALKRRGVEQIIASEPSARRRESALLVGANEAVDPIRTSWVELVHRDRALFVFNTTGVPGMLDRLFHEAPERTHIVEVSGLMEPDTIRSLAAVSKNMTVSFSSAGDLGAFSTVLDGLADGSIPGSALITDEVGLDGVAGAFDVLEAPNDHVKILVRPAL